MHFAPTNLAVTKGLLSGDLSTKSTQRRCVLAEGDSCTPMEPDGAKAKTFSCSNKPQYSGGGSCPNYYGCHSDSATKCSCLDYCSYDGRCCEAKLVVYACLLTSGDGGAADAAVVSIGQSVAEAKGNCPPPPPPPPSPPPSPPPPCLGSHTECFASACNDCCDGSYGEWWWFGWKKCH